ncbi:CHASE3 domain-containing protein [Flavobacterium sp. Arc2]|jgi:CHASE3 domain sensor protein|uniref:CHASE3 domain-containing protein n=1 Tax=Flavobacterium sp. Arc2 TaxID=3046685 RepID=UPI00352E230A
MVSSIVSFISIRSLSESNSLVNHTQEVIYNLNDGAAQAVEAKTSMRGFLVTGSENFLSHFDEAEENTNAYFKKVEQLAIDNPIQQNSLKDFEKRSELQSELERSDLETIENIL